MRADGPWAAGLADALAWAAFSAVPVLGLVELARRIVVLRPAPSAAAIAAGALGGIVLGSRLARHPRLAFAGFTALLAGGAMAPDSRGVAVAAVLSMALAGISWHHGATLGAVASPALQRRLAAAGRALGGGFAVGLAVLAPGALPVAAPILCAALLLFVAWPATAPTAAVGAEGMVATLCRDAAATSLLALSSSALPATTALVAGVLVLQVPTLLPHGAAPARGRGLLHALACTKLAAVAPTLIGPLLWGIVVAGTGRPELAALSLAALTAVACAAARAGER